MSTTDDSSSKNGNDPGKPGDAVAALAAAAVKWSSAPAPDPKVSSSFSLGWHVAQSVAWATTGDEPHDQFGLEAQEPQLRWDVLVGQIDAARKQLLPDASPAVLSDKPPTSADVDGLTAMSDGSLRDLYVVDSALGKAFLLGLELHKLCIDPSAVTRDALESRRGQIDRLLRDLASKLPANAAHSVLNSLSLWDAQLDPPQPKTRWFGSAAQAPLTPPSPADVSTALRHQGFVWYAMLAGEVAAKDILRLSDYVGTGEEVVKRLRELAWRAVQTKTGVVLASLVLALLVVGAVLLFSSHVAAGVTSVIAALGVTWKAIGDFFGRAAARGEEALWDAQVDWTIAYRCTVPIAEPSDQRTMRSQRIDDHFATWNGWLQRWPSLSGDDAPSATADAGRASS